MRFLSPTELKLKIKKMTEEHNLLDHAIRYFSQYGEPQGFSSIREVLAKRKEFLGKEMKKYQAQLNNLTLTNLLANRIE